MKRTSENWAVYSANSYKGQINPKPAYQRGPVWSVNHQQLFIDSMLRGYDIPKLYLSTVTDDTYSWDVVDGQQRLRAIWEFFDDSYPLSQDADPIDGKSIAGLRHSQLHPELLRLLDTYQLSIVIFDDADDTEIEEMFIRLQNGVPLNSAEKRHAISGGVRDFVHNIANNHPFITGSLSFQNKRYAHDELVAQMLLVEMHQGLTRLRHTQLKDLYETNKQFRANSTEGARLKRVLNYLANVFPDKSPELNKVNSISLYTLLTVAMRQYVLNNREKDIRTWFFDFQNRRAIDDDLSEDDRDPTLMSYQYAVSRQSADIISQQIRHRILSEDLATHLTDLMPLDNQRLYTAEQRAAIYRLADGRCSNPAGNPDCELRCSAENFHADHVVPHSRGGATIVANGQLLCVSCNLKKGAG